MTVYSDLELIKIKLLAVKRYVSHLEQAALAAANMIDEGNTELAKLTLQEAYRDERHRDGWKN